METSLRLDKWLWFARLYKTRSLAAEQCRAGHVTLNGTKVVKASQTVKPGDVVTAVQGPFLRTLTVVAIGERRGPAAEAQALYDEPLEPLRLKPKRQAPPEIRDKGAGRPTKKDRRATDRLKGED